MAFLSLACRLRLVTLHLKSHMSRMTCRCLSRFRLRRTLLRTAHLDQSDALTTRSLIYRAMTRAHMLVVVVNEFLPGGWLAFLRTLKLEGKAEEAPPGDACLMRCERFAQPADGSAAV